MNMNICKGLNTNKHYSYVGIPLPIKLNTINPTVLRAEKPFVVAVGFLGILVCFFRKVFKLLKKYVVRLLTMINKQQEEGFLRLLTP